MTRISAKVIADSKNEFGNRITTVVVTFPRFILAELNTHRMMSRNSASSRAIPFKKMLESVKTNPFIPIAWQKDHPGMQGTEYLSKTDKYCLSTFINSLVTTLNSIDDKESKEYQTLDAEIEEKINLIENLLQKYKYGERTLGDWWLLARDKAIEAACIMYVFRTTKQLANRLLEPFMWHTVIITATEWENFFALRCPRYVLQMDEPSGNTATFRSRKEAISYMEEPVDLEDTMWWLSKNKGQAEIHMMELAECMWDVMNESTPKELKAGEWHIPFDLKWNETSELYHILGIEEYTKQRSQSDLDKIQIAQIKIATARCARVSYTVVGEEDKPVNYENDIKLHDRLAESGHMSPFEHSARAMSRDEFIDSKDPDFLQKCSYNSVANKEAVVPTLSTDNKLMGNSGNLKGFIQYRKTLPNENITK